MSNKWEKERRREHEDAEHGGDNLDKLWMNDDVICYDWNEI